MIVYSLIRLYLFVLFSFSVDTSRNQLLIANTSLSVLACSIALGAYFTGVFGMNLDNTMSIQSTRGVFVGVFIATLVLIAGVYYFTILHYNKTGVIPTAVKQNID